MEKKLYLIRHGQTDWNLAHRIQGKQDIPLNEAGKRQARFLAKGMENRPVGSVFSSRLSRARETAGFLAESQKAPLFIVDGLEEISYGKWEGMTLLEIQQYFPERFAQWWKDPVNGAPPDGESQMDVLRRTAAAMEAIQKHMAAGGAQAAAVVSHGASIHCMLAWLLKEEAPSDCPIHNASICCLRGNENGHLQAGNPGGHPPFAKRGPLALPKISPFPHRPLLPGQAGQIFR